MKDIYVKFEGATELQGDSTDTKHVNEIEVSSFSHKITQPKSASASTSGGHTAERTEHGEMVFTKEVDKASSKLLRACSAGTRRAFASGSSATRMKSTATSPTRTRPPAKRMRMRTMRRRTAIA